jgi:SAM-dependent methyltransferase
MPSGMLGRDYEGLRDYFDEMKGHHPAWWARFGERPDFCGKRIMDLGSGVGAMAVEMGQAGAAEVIGVELHQERVDFANRHVAERFPELGGRVRFCAAELAALNMQNELDMVVSKDTFEHVQNVPEMLAFLRSALKPGGEIWAGFSPLWRSPNGDHGLAGGRLPWEHLMLPRPRVLERMSAKTGRPILSLVDVDLNAMSPQEFRSAVTGSGLEFRSINYNARDKSALRAMSVARRLPGLEALFTAGIYAVIVRP